MTLTALVVGVANHRSLAWASTLALLRRGEFGHVVVTYQNDRFRTCVETMVATQNDELLKQHYNQEEESPCPRISCLSCDVACEESVHNLCSRDLPSTLLQHSAGPRLNAVVHSVAYAPQDAMKYGSLLTTSRSAFETAHVVSSYSLLLLARHALPLLTTDTSDPTIQTNDDNINTTTRSSSSITALTYLGSTRAVPNYNVMGPAKASLESIVRGLALELGGNNNNCPVRVNAVSAGPVTTLASRGGIQDFARFKRRVDETCMLQRSIASEEIGNAVAFLAGRDSSGITGQTLFVDGGFNTTTSI